MERFDLDDESERGIFLARFKTMTGRALANRLGLSGKGSARLATDLSCYAWNAHVAFGERKAGRIETARQYEGICDRIYSRSLSDLGWW